MIPQNVIDVKHSFGTIVPSKPTHIVPFQLWGAEV